MKIRFLALALLVAGCATTGPEIRVVASFEIFHLRVV